jgi:GH3 auxin-responsive promoter
MRATANRFLRETKDCMLAQTNALERILKLNAESDYAREFGLGPALTVEEFRQRQPVCIYEWYRPWIDRLRHGESSAMLGPANRLLMFALSSGTTAETKYVPITDHFLNSYRQGWQVWGIRAFDAHPKLHQMDIMQLASDYDQHRTPAGIPCGNISGLVSKMQKPIVRSMYTIPQVVGKIKDPEAKQYVSLRYAIANAHIGLGMTANPSTLIQMADQLDKFSERLLHDLATGTLDADLKIPGDLRQSVTKGLSADRTRACELARRANRRGLLSPMDVWPDLQLIGVWTGGSVQYYLPALKAAFGEVPVRDHGLSASEGRMTIPLADGTSAGLLDATSHFFEFIPEGEHGSSHPTVLTAEELEPGENYSILLTTASGLYRYDIHDVVRCTGHWGTTPLLEFLHKGAHVSNLTGEKLSESQVVAAVSEACRQLDLEIGHFTVSPVWDNPPFYRLHHEALDAGFSAMNRGLEAALGLRLGQVVDELLQQQNCEYRDKRESGRLQPLETYVLPPGTWERFFRMRQSRPGGSLEQYKHPCLSPKLDFSAGLEMLAVEEAQSFAA